MHYREVPEIQNYSQKNELFYLFNPLEKVIKKLMHSGVPICTPLKEGFKIKPIHSTASLSDIVLHTHFIWVYISVYVDNGTAKVSILAKIGVRVQG